MSRLRKREHAESIKEEPIILKSKKKKQLYPAYSTYVVDELTSLVAEKEGFTEKIADATDEQQKIYIQNQLQTKVDEVIAEGITIYTALDPVKQNADETYVTNLLNNTRDLQAASVVINNETREIISLYGGKDYKKFDFHRAYQAVRQPGSAFKPLLVYAPVFETTSLTPSNLIKCWKSMYRNVLSKELRTCSIRRCNY